MLNNVSLGHAGTIHCNFSLKCSRLYYTRQFRSWRLYKMILVSVLGILQEYYTS